MYWWSLRFINPVIEARYREERRGLKRIPRAIAIFFGITLATMVVMYVIDLINGLFLDPDYSQHYNFTIYDILAYVSFVPILLIELLFYKCQCLARARGTFFTAALYLAIFYASLSYYVQLIDYPVVGGT